LKIKLDTDELNLQMVEICHQPNCNEQILQNHPELTYFEIDKNMLQCAEGLSNFEVSRTFDKIWEECVQKAKKQNTFSNIQDVVDQIWQPAQVEFRDLFERLKTGEITLSEVKKYFGIDEENQKLKAEFENICQAFQEPDTWVMRCTEQVKQYLSYSQCSSGAVAMRRLISQLELQGNYDKLNDILSLVCIAFSMYCIYLVFVTYPYKMTSGVSTFQK